MTGVVDLQLQLGARGIQLRDGLLASRLDVGIDVRVGEHLRRGCILAAHLHRDDIGRPDRIAVHLRREVGQSQVGLHVLPTRWPSRTWISVWIARSRFGR